MATRTCTPTAADEVDYLAQTVGATANLPKSWFRDDLSVEYMAGTNLADRSVVRATERGRQARLARDRDGQITGFRVASDTGHGTYTVTVRQATTVAVYFGCNCKSGQYRSAQPIPCAHVGAVVRRLKRANLVTLDPETGLCRPTQRAEELAGRKLPEPKPVADPFKGLPRF